MSSGTAIAHLSTVTLITFDIQTCTCGVAAFAGAHIQPNLETHQLIGLDGTA
jgi:hypothetical protein